MSASKFENAAYKIIVDDLIEKCKQQELYSLHWVREAYVGKPNGKHGLVDLKVMYLNLRAGVISHTVNYEMKSGYSDLTNGRGLNFNADYNYVVYPRDSSRYIKTQNGNSMLTKEKISKWLDKRKGVHIGIICIENDNSITVERIARRKKGKPRKWVIHGTKF